MIKALNSLKLLAIACVVSLGIMSPIQKSSSHADCPCPGCAGLPPRSRTTEENVEQTDNEAKDS